LLLLVVAGWYWFVYRKILATTFYADAFSRCQNNPIDRTCWSIQIVPYVTLALGACYAIFTLVLQQLAVTKTKRYLVRKKNTYVWFISCLNVMIKKMMQSHDHNDDRYILSKCVLTCYSKKAALHHHCMELRHENPIALSSPRVFSIANTKEASSDDIKNSSTMLKAPATCENDA
jgi:hypothetical protein